MHMKYDYYNHTNVFKPGYNVQVGVSNGYIAYSYISGDTNDIRTLQPFTEGYKKLYGNYPKVEVTDQDTEAMKITVTAGVKVSKGY